MKPQGVGAIAKPVNDEEYLSYDWYRQLTPVQLEAYIRYLFVALREHEYDVEAPVHTARRVNWDGGTNQYGHTHKRIWTKIAAAIKAAKVVPGTWVAAHFSAAFHAVRIAESKGYIGSRPELLCSGLSLDVYKQYIASFDSITTRLCAAADYSIGTQMAMLENVISNYDDLILYVVSDKTNVNATPFFRHAFAAQERAGPCRRAIDKYIDAAALEYDINQQLYDDLALLPGNEWWISPELKQVVADKRKYWRRYRG